MQYNIARTLNYGERVSSSYAEIYFDERCSKLKRHIKKTETKHPLTKTNYKEIKNNVSSWTSPSDLMIGILDLKPPFTSKITRGKTHEGILAIGNDILEKEHGNFFNYLTTLIYENDGVWNQILQQERVAVDKKVNKIYKNIFMNKSKIMKKEIATFYEETLQELENHLRSELRRVLLSTRASIISNLNKEIKDKLEKEKNVLGKVLQQRYVNEIFKIKKYYGLLLQNEIYRNNKIINYVMNDRNDALKSFCRQVEIDNITSTMYVMCTERKKCKVKHFLLENTQNYEIKENLQKIKEKEGILDQFASKDITLNEINREWEDRMKKIIQLFLKFISFTLKLLPEQTTFLLDFQKMVVLQINEIYKTPKKCSSIIIPEEELLNVLLFEKPQPEKSVCHTEPFVVVGDTSDIPAPRYGSRETIPSDVDLPTIRLQRQYIYAKCHNFEEIKDALEKDRCKCSDITVKVPILPTVTIETPKQTHEDVCVDCDSSNELLLVENKHRLHKCPARGCKDWFKRQSFPFLEDYIDFTEENFERVKTILDQPLKEEIIPELIDPKSIAYADLVFGPTNEHTVETQYSSQDDLSKLNIECSCVDNSRPKINIYHQVTECTSKLTSKLARESDSANMINKIVMKRQNSMMRLLQENDNLLKMFNDGIFDFE